jgi:hypothetical protein
VTEFPDGVADFFDDGTDFPDETDFPDDFGRITLSADSPLVSADKEGSIGVLAVDLVRGFLIVAIAEIVNNKTRGKG